MNSPCFSDSNKESSCYGTQVNTESLEAIDENFFYKHFITHFHSLFCESTIICIPQSTSIQGLVITKDIIESHCFQPSPYFCDQYVAIKKKQKIITLDKPIIKTVTGYKEERTVNILDEDTFFLKSKKIKLLLIDRLLEGEPPKYQYHHKHNMTIPSTRNSRTDLDFLNMFSDNFEALNELQVAVQEFTDSYVYIKGYNKAAVEKIQHMYMKTYRTILERNKLLQESCSIPSEHDQYLELVENVVMSFLHKKIWIQSLKSLFASQDNYIDSICCTYTHVTLSQYSLRYPISEMNRSSFEQAIENFRRLDSDRSTVEPYKSTLKSLAFTPLEKLAVVQSTLSLISSAVHEYVTHYGNGHNDTSVTSDEMIPLLAYVIVQSRVPRIAGIIYYMQHYRLARMAEGSVYNFVLTTIKSAVEFLKDDPLSLLNDDTPITSRIRKSHSVDDFMMEDLLLDRLSSRPHIVLPERSIHHLDIPHPWYHEQQHIAQPIKPYHHLASTQPLVSTTFPALHQAELPTLRRSWGVAPPKVIRLGLERPMSLDGREISQELLMGDFLIGLGQLEGNVVGGRSGTYKNL